MAAKRKKITLAEFKAWIQGIEELQSKDWSPNAEQWKMIREKIELITEAKQLVAEAPLPPPPMNRPVQQQPRPMALPPGHVPFIPPPPPVPGGVPEDAVITGVAPKLGNLPPAGGAGGSSFA